MRKIGLILGSLLVVAFASNTFAQKYAIIKPTKPGIKSEAIHIDKKFYKKLVKNNLTGKDLTFLQSTHDGIVDTIYHSRATAVNWGIAVGDSQISFYDPPAGCFIKEIGIVGQTWEAEPLADGFLFSINKFCNSCFCS